MNQVLLNEAEKEFFEILAEKLPPILARQDIEFFLGGIVSPLTVKNADLAGQGPEIAWRVGNKVAYKTDSLLCWLVKKFGVTRIQNVSTLSDKGKTGGRKLFTAPRVASGNKCA